MVYVATRRAQWSLPLTGLKFAGTTLILGAASLLLLSAFRGGTTNGSGAMVHLLSGGTLLLATLKLTFEAGLLRDARARQHSARKQVAVMMLGPLRAVTGFRFATGLLGVALSGALFSGLLAGFVIVPVALVALVALSLGELLERGLFFSASPTLRMPGGAS